MPRMRIVANTAWSDDLRGTRKLPAGTGLEVDGDVQKRWHRHGIAEDTDLPVGYYPDEEANKSDAEIDAQIGRLEALKKARRSEAEGAAAEASREDEHPLARYDLTEKQRVALERAGFTRPEIVDQAGDAELLEVEGIGESALAKLRKKD
jgi:hypothetical protein